jgi:multidrug transporter EmrE-like cation transporter
VSGAALTLVVAAAVCHALWNALAKRARQPLVFLWSSVTLATLALSLPSLALVTVDALHDAWPFLVASVGLHALYFYALSASYGAGDFSRVYPIARGLGVALVPVVAYLAFGERLAPLGIVGIALVVVGIIAINLLPRGTPAPSGLWRLGRGTGWALLTGGRLEHQSHELLARALRVPPLEGRIRRGRPGALHSLLRPAGEHLASGGTPRAPLGRCDRGRRRGRVRRHGPLKGGSSFTRRAATYKGAALVVVFSDSCAWHSSCIPCLQMVGRMRRPTEGSP